MDTRETFCHVACTLALVAVFAGTLPASAQQSGSISPSAATTSPSTNNADSIPDSPGAVRSSSQDEKTSSADSIAVLEQTQTEPGGASPQQNAPPQKPVGTAAAEAPNVNAISASQPAGVAIAPAKQRRVRTIILKTGAIVGAGVAIGVIVALTAATPPKPPGAH